MRPNGLSGVGQWYTQEKIAKDQQLNKKTPFKTTF